MATKPTRVPEEVHQELQAAGRVLGVSPGELLERAWSAYRESPEFLQEFQLLQKAFANNDLETVTSLLKEKADERAEQPAARVANLRT